MSAVLAERCAGNSIAPFGARTEVLAPAVDPDYSSVRFRHQGLPFLVDTEQLDRIDRNILDTLSREGRLSSTELARRVGLSKTPVQARVRRLEKDGYIRGYAALIDRERMGEGHIAFVQVTLSDTRSAALDAFNQAVLKVREIEQCHMIAGGFDYLLKIRTKDISSYRRVLGERISALPHVAQTSTFVAMETVKDR
jgi:Lrp/AsnC family leucine-responsive transcriptional regulator